jgi:hypothetical protein
MVEKKTKPVTETTADVKQPKSKEKGVVVTPHPVARPWWLKIIDKVRR